MTMVQVLPHVELPDVNPFLSILSGGVNPFHEARETAKSRVGRQPAEVGCIEIEVNFCVPAIDNNWNRVIRRFEREFDHFHLGTIIPPCPACHDWTIKLYYQSLDGIAEAIERDRDHIERIANDRRR